MRAFVYVFYGIIFCGFICVQETFAKNLLQKDRCRDLIKIAENKEMDWIYDMCGFDDEVEAWQNWAPFLTKNNYKKGMYILCQKYPTHEYSSLYCEKAAQAGYIPAVYEIAQEFKHKEDYQKYIENLQKIVDKIHLSDKLILKTPEEKIALKAYQELGFSFLNGKWVEKNLEKALQYLKTAADLGNVEAAHAVAILLYLNGGDNQKALADSYWWKAIMKGCPAAEETYGVLSLYLSSKLSPEKMKEKFQEKMYSCEASDPPKSNYTKSIQMCDCPGVLAWNKSQADKPYVILSISSKNAVLQDKNGDEETVTPMELTSAGYFVREIRPSAVILTKGPERYVLLKSPDRECLDICQNPNLVQTRSDNVRYSLQFTPEVCRKIAGNVEMLEDPSIDFKGLKECSLKNWSTWGQWALNNKKNKLLYLLGNYQQSDYIPSQMEEIERYYNSRSVGDDILVKNLFTYISTQKPVDKLSFEKKEQAFCIRSYYYMTGDTKNDELAFSWAKAGADLGYPYSMNMLGILYATGTGVQKDTEKAAQYFLKADEIMSYPFVDARYNYNILKSNTLFDAFRLGKCREIIEPVYPSEEEVVRLYE